MSTSLHYVCVTWLLSLMTVTCNGKTKEYFIAAENVEWNYAPTGQNLVNPQEQREADFYLKHGSDRIGSTYTKVIYKQYTDSSFSVEIPKPAWLGMIGPIIKAEVDDVIIVHFLNRGSRVYSVHPHGLFYNKKHEGALYLDDTYGDFKIDDHVKPGENFRYEWNVSASNASPTPTDPDCLPWVYHSHVDTPPDTSVGLIGVLLTCKKGVLDDQDRLKGSDKEYVLIAKAFDENLSWLSQNNTEKCGDPQACLHSSDEDDFKKSNIMYSLNGYMYGHLRGLDACAGDKITWYIIGMGNEIDVHSLHFHGQILHYEHHSGDTVPVFAAIFKTAVMTTPLPGRWLINCMVSDHFRGGMSAYFNVFDCGKQINVSHGNGNTRWFYLSVEEEVWDYGASGIDRLTGKMLDLPGSPSEIYFAKGPYRIGGKYKKVRYHQYDDQSFVNKVADIAELGILGPVLRMEVGDNVNIVLKNFASRPYSFLGHSLRYENSDEGAYDGAFHHGIVQPGTTHIYHTHVPDDLLSDAEPDCVVQLYHSAVNEVRDVNSGLIGPLLICKRGKLDNGVKQVDINKEFYLLFATFDENLSWYLDDNMHTYCANASDVDKENDDFKESNMMHGINGLSFTNLEGLTMCLGDNVTWHTMSYGSETNVQSPYFHGNTYSVAGTNRDTGHLISGGTQSLLMVPDNPGKWLIVSENSKMFERGTSAMYTVNTCNHDLYRIDVSGVTRHYIIAAEEVEWDYAPTGKDYISGADLRPPSSNFIFMKDDNYFIGRKYKKAIFREYTDASFTTIRPRGSDDIHLGIMGPLIKAEVGDTIEIVFKNKASRPYSIHPHGLFYDKADAGYSYPDDMFLEAKKGIAPSDLYIYHWHVPKRAGPGPNDPNCIPWLYSSGVDSAKDSQSGLVGSIVVCRKGVLDVSGKRKDVDREFALLFSVFNENHSWYLKENIHRYAPGRELTKYDEDADFTESNKMHSVNGLIAANNEGLVMKSGDTTVWYLLSFGTEIDLHTIHFHAHTFIQRSNHKHRTDVLALFPSNAEAVTIVMENPGKWILHCHVLDHITAGMETVYTVLDSDSSPSGFPFGKR